MFGWKKKREKDIAEELNSRNKQGSKKTKHLSFEDYVTECMSISSYLYKTRKFELMRLLKATETIKNNYKISASSISKVNSELKQYLNIITYLIVQQSWEGFDQSKAAFLADKISSFNYLLRKDIKDSNGINFLKNRLANYDEVILNKIPHFGQSLYHSFNDTKLDEIKSDAFGRCALLFTDFVFYATHFDKFATLEDLKPFIVIDFTDRIVLSTMSIQVIMIAIEIIKEFQQSVKHML